MYMYVCMYMYVYVCMYVCMYVTDCFEFGVGVSVVEVGGERGPAVRFPPGRQEKGRRTGPRYLEDSHPCAADER